MTLLILGADINRVFTMSGWPAGQHCRVYKVRHAAAQLRLDTSCCCWHMDRRCEDTCVLVCSKTGRKHNQWRREPSGRVAETIAETPTTTNSQTQKSRKSRKRKWEIYLRNKFWKKGKKYLLKKDQQFQKRKLIEEMQHVRVYASIYKNDENQMSVDTYVCPFENLRLHFPRNEMNCGSLRDAAARDIQPR